MSPQVLYHVRTWLVGARVVLVCHSSETCCTKTIPDKQTIASPRPSIESSAGDVPKKQPLPLNHLFIHPVFETPLVEDSVRGRSVRVCLDVSFDVARPCNQTCAMTTVCHTMQETTRRDDADDPMRSLTKRSVGLKRKRGDANAMGRKISFHRVPKQAIVAPTTVCTGRTSRKRTQSRSDVKLHGCINQGFRRTS